MRNLVCALHFAQMGVGDYGSSRCLGTRTVVVLSVVVGVRSLFFLVQLCSS